MRSVISESVDAYDYDPVRSLLTVRFQDGSVYEYYDVPQAFADEFSVPHPWHRVYNRIKIYSYQRVA